MKQKLNRLLLMSTALLCFVGGALAYHSQSITRLSPPQNSEMGIVNELSINSSNEIKKEKVSGDEDNEAALSQVQNYQTQLVSLCNEYINDIAFTIDSVKNEYTPQLQNCSKKWADKLQVLIANYYASLELSSHLSEAQHFFLSGSEELVAIYNDATTANKTILDTKKQEDATKRTIEHYQSQITSIADNYIYLASFYKEDIRTEYIPKLENSRDNSNKILLSLINDYYPSSLSNHAAEALQFFVNGSDELAHIYNEAQIAQNKANDAPNNVSAKKEIDSYISQISKLMTKYLKSVDLLFDEIKTEYAPRIKLIGTDCSEELQNLISLYNVKEELHLHLSDAQNFFIKGSEELTETYNAAIAVHTAIEKKIQENENAKATITLYQTKLSSNYRVLYNKIGKLIDIVQDVYLPQLTETNTQWHNKLQELIDKYYKQEQLSSHLDEAHQFFLTGSDELTRIFDEASSIHENDGKSIVSVELSPNKAGTTNIQNIIANKGDSLFIYASLSPKFRFVKWEINGDSISSNPYMFFVVPDGYSKIKGISEMIEGEELFIEPSSDILWKESNKELVIRNCVAGELANRIDDALHLYEISNEDILRCELSGNLAPSDLWSFSILKNCSTIDLKTVRLMDVLPTSAFFSNYKLKELYLPASIKEIGDFSFSNPSPMTKIVCYAETPPIVHSNTFRGVPFSISVLVPQKALEQYRNADGWSDFNIQPIDAVEYEGFNLMTLQLKSDKNIQFLLGEKPIITFVNNEICIRTTFADINYPLKDFKKITYSYLDDVTKIADILIDSDTNYDIRDKIICFHGVQTDAILKVITMDGKLVAQKKITSINGDCEYDLSYLNAGIYCIVVDGIICKIAIK